MLPTSPHSRGASPGRPPSHAAAAQALSGTASFAPAHPVLHAGRVAVITGAASGIGAAAARAFAQLGMRVALADLPAAADALAAVAAAVKAELARRGVPADEATKMVLVVPTDVTQLSQVVALKDTVYDAWHEVGVLMNNAGISGALGGVQGTSLDGLDAWHAVFNVNVFGVVNVQQVFVPAMLHQENPAMVINTGSKQGITNPPGNTAYNASKAAVKSLTEGLAHHLRTHAGAAGGGVSAHLFVPGYTFTGLTGATAGAAKPAAAWSAEETVKHMLARVAAGDFYVLCPDGETGPEMDQLRVMWAAADVAQGRPALSRWHRDYKALFEEYMREGQALAAEGQLVL
ncbi:hypothetical protein DFH07DRAFT_866988 [Mycena maculata]|uniref:NAD(P)-binding protein n=1 Tax=Mycena maculata TaxID=230809 RepID=A0AAD7JP49_9AGAR|nr:hypothetical protein DFH07DRAFT_866988 [Mycena maculata]